MSFPIEYPKIQTMFKRDDRNLIVEGDWTTPELNYLQNNEWLFTEKVDGTNMRVIYDGNGGVEFRGRTDAANIQPSVDAGMALYRTPEMIQRVQEVFDGSPVILFGEGYGKGVQKIGEKYIPDGCSFVLFDVYIPTSPEGYADGVQVDGWWLNRENQEDVATKLGIPIVPVVGKGTLHDGIAMVRDGFKSNWGDFIAEGLIAVTTCGLFDRKGRRLNTKIKWRDFNDLKRKG